MPLFEVPPETKPESSEEADPKPSDSGQPEPSGKPAPRFGRLRPSARTANLDAMQPHELITLVEDLEDDRTRARVREGIYISLFLHILIFWLYAYAPQVLFHRPRVVNPADVMAQRPQDYQFLDLPPDALKKLTPHTKILSDQNRVAQTKTPSIDKKTLAQLEAMKPAGPPAPSQQQPSPQNQTPQQAPAAQQQGQQTAQQQPQQTLRPTPTPQPEQQAQNNLPASPQPNLRSLMGGGAGQQIQRAIPRSGTSGGDYGSGYAPHHQGVNSGMEVLSDTLGVDFGPYMARLKFLIERAWYPLIPEAARPPLSRQGVVQIRFRIMPDGSLAVAGMHLDGKSGDVSLDRAAWGGVTGASPFPPLPKEYLDHGGKYLDIRGGFFYNLTPDQLK